MKYAVGKSIPKFDALPLVTGQPIYTEDLTPPGALEIYVLRSPHAFAKICSLQTDAAQKVPGVACVLTHHDVPRIRHTLGGSLYAFASPADRYILEDYVRYVGDAVAIVAADTRQTAQKAARLIRVVYEKLEPVFDPRKALDHQPPVHPEADYPQGWGVEPKRNLVGHMEMNFGDGSATFETCDVVLEGVYHTRANAHCMMETFRTHSYYDQNGKLTLIASTQIPFLVRRTVAGALGLPVGNVRVIKPRVGGGFGAKQSLVSELFCALVTLKTGRAASLVYSRTESFTASNSRHENILTVKMGATEDGVVQALSLHTLSNAGAYGEQAFSTALLSGIKTLPMFAKTKSSHFSFDIVYTNTMAGGAFRGYGSTQGFFATESMANRMAAALGIDPVELRLRNIPREGDYMEAQQERLESAALDRCIETGREMIGWAEKYPRVEVDEDHVRAVGMAVAMQSSGIAGVEKATARARLNEDGSYTVYNGAGDMGTGADTVLAQIAAETLQCGIEQITAAGVDTDHSPYDRGSYASGTTFLSGMAMVKACRALAELVREEGAKALGVPEKEALFDGAHVYTETQPRREISLAEVAQRQVTEENCPALVATGANRSAVSPPPLMAGFVEIELDRATGQVKVLDYVGVVDCGTVINPALARTQAMGGIVQGIGMALYEDVQYNPQGRLCTRNFLQYKIPTRLDMPPIRVAFESSYEPAGPYGAKSIGEVVINTPPPAIAHAIYNACGVWLNDLPMTPEKVLAAL